MIYDTHAHLDYPDFAADLPEVIGRARTQGVSRIIAIGTDLESSRRVLRLSEQYDALFAAVGWHPTHVLDAPDDVRADLRALARHPKVVAIGETGLDFYRLPSQQAEGEGQGAGGGGQEPGEEARYKQRQVRLFDQQLDVAAELGLNVIIHQRGDVLQQTLDCLQPWTGRVRGVFHCFAGDVAALGQVLSVGSLVSFTGILTFKNGANVREALAATPTDRFMLETDCPFLAPVPHRGRRCEPVHVLETARVAAEVKGCSLEELGRVTCETAHRFFRGLGRP